MRLRNLVIETRSSVLEAGSNIICGDGVLELDAVGFSGEAGVGGALAA